MNTANVIAPEGGGRFERVYENGGNFPLIAMLGECSEVLDVGCGAGSNALLIKRAHPAVVVSGITCSKAEADLASKIVDNCWLLDLENDLPDELSKKSFDALIFSHVLEHLRDPSVVVEKFTGMLSPGGQLLIAVPNVLGWRERLGFMFGKFEYESSGVLDDTHLRFFTYFTADKYLLAKCDELTVIQKKVTGGMPLWWFRRYLFPLSWCEAIDRMACKYWPNLFGGQVLIKAVKN